MSSPRKERHEAHQLRRAAMKYARAKLFGTVDDEGMSVRLGTERGNTVEHLGRELLRMAEWYFEVVSVEAVEKELE
jgi:hypothetical protein